MVSEGSGNSSKNKTGSWEHAFTILLAGSALIFCCEPGACMKSLGAGSDLIILLRARFFVFWELRACSSLFEEQGAR